MSEIARRAVEEARGWIGTPYRHQAAAKGAGADCLGLLRGVWRALYGTELTQIVRYSRDWSETGGEERLWHGLAEKMIEKPVAAAAAGDVVLLRMRTGSVAKHLGLQAQIGPEASFIHAYWRHGVVESALSLPWARRVVARFEFPSGGV